MKKIVLILLCLAGIGSLSAQTDFQELSLEKALEKAKIENKLVFVDCYTSWCGPCKMMADKIFPLKEVGDYLNEKFVCVKYDMEKGEGQSHARKYQVSSYPTFLILQADGRLQHRIVGGSAGGNEFLERIEKALKGNSLPDLEERYRSGNRDLSFLTTYIQALTESAELEKARGITQELLVSLDGEEKRSPDYWFIYESRELSPVGSGNMIYLLKHVDKFREQIGKEKVDAVVAGLYEEELEEILRGRNRVATLADVEATEQQWNSYQLPEGRLGDYFSLVKALMKEDTAEVLTLYLKMFPELSDEKISYLYFNPLAILKEKWNKKQKKELVELTRRIQEQVELDKLKISLGRFAEEIDKRW